MRADTLERARFHQSRMNPKDDPRIFKRTWSTNPRRDEFLICAHDARPSEKSGWVEIKEPTYE